MRKSVVILGASNKPERYAHKALTMLLKCGYTVIPVHPTLMSIDGIAVVHSLADVPVAVQTLTMYLGPQRSEPLVDAIVALRPERVIFNPGTESELLERELAAKGIRTIRACTLVLLRSGRFDCA